MKLNIEILKEPKGFIKVIEVFIAIFAFSTTAGYTGRVLINGKCNVTNTTGPTRSPTGDIAVDVDYPFKTMHVIVGESQCTMGKVELHLDANYQSESQYFVTVGVFCFLYALGITVYYVLFEETRESRAASTDVGLFSFPVVDFVISVALAFGWFTSSIAWAAGVSGLKAATNAASLVKDLSYCKAGASHAYNSCSVQDAATYGALNVSILLGFLNLFVWGMNLWFLFKETPWHSPRRGPAAYSSSPAEIEKAEPPHQEPPPASL